jgi:hypothetical protein
MTTRLRKFQEAYATMTVAIYEPLILRWVSGWTLLNLANTVAWREPKGKRIDLDKALATAHALTTTRIRPALPSPEVLSGVEVPLPTVELRPVDEAGNPISTGEVVAVELSGFPDAVAVGGKLYLQGLLNVQLPNGGSDPGVNVDAESAPAAAPPQGNAVMGARNLPTTLNGVMGVGDPDFQFTTTRGRLFSELVKAARGAQDGTLATGTFHGVIRQAGLYDFLPPERIEEALSPIGVAHFHRQLYFNADEGYGPIEEAFTVAPLESLEVVYETVRRQIHEEVVELGSEEISETATEEKNLEEVSDKVSSMIQRDASAAMSANVSGSIGVWQAGASASANFATSSQRSREESTRRLKEVTKRASERITKSFTLRTRDVLDVTTTNLTRRIIKNESDHPVSFGLRRVLRRVLVKTQDLGPRLVWQLYVCNPGAGLARSRFVHFREAEPIAVPEVPPGMPPRPKGGTDTGTTSSDLHWDAAHSCFVVTLVVQTSADRVVKAVSIDSLTDLEGGGKDDTAPSPRNDIQFNKHWDEATATYTVSVGILPGDSASLNVGYTYTWDPAPAVHAEWEAERQRRVKELTEQTMNERFEREKLLITERSKIRVRPPADLRREERYEIMNRMVSQLFARGDDPSEPAPLEIEYFHRYFDINSMFTYTHPSWWKPRYAPVGTGLGRPAYEITAESEPAPLGSSLGWMIQLDGDSRRNEFLNSPWVRICLPIHPSREREAILWLARHVEGEVGYDLESGPLHDLLAQVEDVRTRQAALGTEGPDYVTIDSTVEDEPGDPDEPLRPQDLFPIISEFEVTVPTDGFVYDELILVQDKKGTDQEPSG